MCFWAKNNCTPPPHAPCSHLVTGGKHGVGTAGYVTTLCKTSDRHRWFIGLAWWRRDVWIKRATAGWREAPRVNPGNFWTARLRLSAPDARCPNSVQPTDDSTEIVGAGEFRFVLNGEWWRIQQEILLFASQKKKKCIDPTSARWQAKAPPWVDVCMPLEPLEPLMLN